MNENCLLHNETAKRLYFEYARKLPIMNFSSRLTLSERPYNNITEAFLLNDKGKLGAMRECGIDDKFICGNASDFEKFKCFCSILPDYAGNPIYLLSHIELQDIYGCELDINEQNCERIWESVNKNILEKSLSEKKLHALAGIEHIPILQIDWREELQINNSIVDLESFENALLNKVREAHGQGCRVALNSSDINFLKPNPYRANEIVKGIKGGKSFYNIYADEWELLEMQVMRTLGIEYVRLGWLSLVHKGAMEKEAKEYLIKNDAFPKTAETDEFVFSFVEESINTLAGSDVLGRLIYILDPVDSAFPYAMHDYFRRALCNYIGKLAERGEYTSDEASLKKLINKILYNNIKELL